jgi:O-antigen ligase
MKYAYWFVKILLACLVIMNDPRPILKLSKSELLFVVLAFIYAAAIFISVFLAPNPGLVKVQLSLSSSGNDILSSGGMDLLGFCLGIVIAFSFRYDPAYESERSFRFFWISLSISLVLAYFLSHETFDLDTNNARYDANSTINSIMYGQTGCALALVSILGAIGNKKWGMKILFLLTFVLGLVSIGKAGSRSPVIVLLIVSIFYFIARMGKFRGVLIISIFGVLVLVLINPIITFLDSIGSSLAVRLTSMIVDKNTSGRDEIYANTWNLIKENPLFGTSYLIPSGAGAGGYPHNYILEVFMATGLVGGIPFLILLGMAIFKSFRIFKSQHPSSWIALLFLQMVVYGMFSSGLYTSQDFWVLLFFMISLNLNILRKPQYAIN